MSGTTDTGAMGAGGSGYAWSKKTLVGYVEQMALNLATRMIRVNAIHPTNCNTHLIHNEELYQVFRPDLENPTRRGCHPRLHLLPGHAHSLRGAGGHLERRALLRL